MIEKLQLACDRIGQELTSQPQIGILIGSGLSNFIDSIEDQVIIPYSEIPYFPTVRIEGHEGRIIIGKIKNVHVIALQGRFHLHEDRTMEEITFPIRCLAMLGIDSLILTSAVGALNTKYQPGDFVAITDHINMLGTNPLIGPEVKQFGLKFPKMTDLYDRELINTCETVARELSIPLKTGVYVAVKGPIYETPAEVRMFNILGGDVIGMSTVPEAIAANHLGVKVMSVTCVSNMASGIERKADSPSSQEVAINMVNQLSDLLTHTINKLGQF